MPLHATGFMRFERTAGIKDFPSLLTLNKEEGSDAHQTVSATSRRFP
jgi:hypothetical protein